MSDTRNVIDEYIDNAISEGIEARVADTLAENTRLVKRVKDLEDQIIGLTVAKRELESELNTEQTAVTLLNTIINNLNQCHDSDSTEKFIYKLLDACFERSFSESTYDTPLWLGAMTNFYAHKNEVYKLFKIFGMPMPREDKMLRFRLPQDWSEDELDIVVKHMSKHYVCNGAIFKDNLRHWAYNATDNVEFLCKNSIYTEIPWQFLLRNPLWLQPKYLNEFGKMAFKDKYISGWRYFFRIDEYQTLTADHIREIVNHMEIPSHLSKDELNGEVMRFLLRNLSDIDNEKILDAIYSACANTWDFDYNGAIFKFNSEKYLIKYITEYKNVKWVIDNKDKIPSNLLEKAFEITTKKELVSIC